MSTFIIFINIILIVTPAVILFYYFRKKNILHKKLQQHFPELWRTILSERVRFYKHLSESDKQLFEKRVQLFLATKFIEAVETEIDDTIRLMIACSAVIPTFAFPDYNYPFVRTILVYPHSFDEHYQTDRKAGPKEIITGMVGNRFQDGTVILSKPDLLNAFDGEPHKSNVGIHEFVHLLDREDGDIDGIPEALMEHRYVGPWLHEIKSEIKRIEERKSDISTYALTNNAEFLAVVSEYFFDNPDKFHKRHPKLYNILSNVFKASINE